MNLFAITDNILQSDGHECVRRMGIIKPFYSSIVIEEAHQNGINEVGEEDKLDGLIQ